ncbi:alpha/beta fold hydrolase [Nocardioides litoris]|uniref:alpha/beta fold hydrolase n=1 Tax=Nocardioides litoris TaxID=1926648 RepID=UPI001B876268|nr:alpha/beta hydrolase [Nocardioides litoris]
MSGPRPRIVLVHGSRLASSQWLPQVPLLEPHVDVVRVDLPGHGSRVGERFTLDRCAEVVQEAVTAHPAPTVVVGHSLGGYVAMAHAQRHHASLAGLVLADCSAAPVGPGAAIYRGVAALTDRIGPERMTRINDRVLRRVYPAEMIEPVIAGGYYFDATPDAWREVMTHCRPSMLHGVRCPVLFLNGRWDQFRLGVRTFRRACPHAEVRVIPGAAHVANLDQPDLFAQALLDFVGRLPG